MLCVENGVPDVEKLVFFLRVFCHHCRQLLVLRNQIEHRFRHRRTEFPLLDNFTRIVFHLLQCHLTPADSISLRHTVVQRILRIGEISCKFSLPAFFSLMSAMCPAQKRDCNQVFTIK